MNPVGKSLQQICIPGRVGASLPNSRASFGSVLRGFYTGEDADAGNLGMETQRLHFRRMLGLGRH